MHGEQNEARGASRTHPAHPRALPAPSHHAAPPNRRHSLGHHSNALNGFSFKIKRLRHSAVSPLAAKIWPIHVELAAPRDSLQRKGEEESCGGLQPARVQTISPALSTATEPELAVPGSASCTAFQASFRARVWPAARPTQVMKLPSANAHGNCSRSSVLPPGPLSSLLHLTSDLSAHPLMRSRCARRSRARCPACALISRAHCPCSFLRAQHACGHPNPGYTQCKCESRCRAQRSPGVLHLHLDTVGLRRCSCT